MSSTTYRLFLEMVEANKAILRVQADASRRKAAANTEQMVAQKERDLEKLEHRIKSDGRHGR